MNEGDVVLTPLLQANGVIKNRPAIVLRKMPPFSDLLVCGVSSQIHQAATGFDEIIEPTHPDFAASGLKTTSLLPTTSARHEYLDQTSKCDPEHRPGE